MYPSFWQTCTAMNQLKNWSSKHNTLICQSCFRSPLVCATSLKCNLHWSEFALGYIQFHIWFDFLDWNSCIESGMHSLLALFCVHVSFFLNVAQIRRTIQLVTCTGIYIYPAQAKKNKNNTLLAHMRRTQEESWVPILTVTHLCFMS